MSGSPNHLLAFIPEEIRKKVLIKLRIDNGQRIFVLSVAGLVFFFLFLGLDYIRYAQGKILFGNLYFYLFLNHLCFAFFLFPVVTIQTRGEAFSIGRFKYHAFFIYTWTIFLGFVLLSMAILSLVDRGDLTMFTLYIIIINFGLLMLHRDRVISNLLSFLVIGVAIVSLYHQDTEAMVINFMEAIGVTMVGFMISTQMFNAYVREIHAEHLLEQKNRLLEAKNLQIEQEKERADELLNNILPREIAQELKSTGLVKPRHFSSATIMLIDFKDFTSISKTLTSEQLINNLDYCFKNFDRITAQFKLEKIKTIGDAYLCVGGVPESNGTHPHDCITAAHHILAFLEDWKTRQMAKNEAFFEGRIGIHTGPLIAGVVGDRKFAFDVWGEAVNITARVETSGEAGKINISQTTYNLVKNKLKCHHRGKIPIKNDVPLDMYFVEGEPIVDLMTFAFKA